MHLTTTLTRRAAITLLAGSLGVGTVLAADKLNVVTTTEDLAALSREIGGDRISVEAIAKGYQNPHYVEPKPSFLLRLRRADLLVIVGLQLESSWLPALITQSRNSRIQTGAQGYLDVSGYSRVLEVPTGVVTRAMGDVHPLGNPHYWLDPENGRLIARAIEARFAELQPSDATYFAERLASFEMRLTEAEKVWDAKMTPYRGREVVSYHRSFSNFCARFQLDVVDYVEPKPGIPPSPAHTLNLINTMNRENIELILVEPYFDLRTPNSIAQKTGARVLVMLPSVGGVKEVTDYFELFDYDIGLLTSAFSKSE